MNDTPNTPEVIVEPETSETVSSAPVVVETPENEIANVEQNLIASAEAFLAACVAFAEVPETPQFYVGEGYRLQFAGHQLMILTTV